MAIPYTYYRRLVRLGNSFYVALPYLWLRAKGIKKARRVIVEAYEDRVVIRLNKEDGKA